MEPLAGKPNSVRNVLVRALVLGVLLLLVRFAYVVTTAGESCRLGDFCFLSPPENLNLVVSGAAAAASAANAVRSTVASPPRRGGGEDRWVEAVRFHGSVFRDLASEGFLSRGARALCFESGSGQDVLALKEMGVAGAVGVSKKASRPLVISGRPHRLPFGDETFDFVFSGGGRFDKVPRPLDAAAEISRTLKPRRVCGFPLRSRDLAGFNASLPKIREIVLKKVSDFSILSHSVKNSGGDSVNKCSVSLIPETEQDLEVYAIEADEHFYEEYKSKKRVTLLPYAAWVKNETLSFEINRDPGQKSEDKGRGMGRIQPVQSSSDGELATIQGFDFAEWLKNTVTEKDFVVMKMDVEGTEFNLIPRLFETGAICLIDELFLECHYNRWQRCCPGERSSKYEKTYEQCLDLFTSLRQSGVLVHQWW
ncbi:hypothetical protein NL676_018680 [Syzygium grande]|nr:hypothetical protein NL676_018680 [Syzygium grande]